MKLNHPIKKIKLSVKAISKIGNWWDYFLDYFGAKQGKVIYNIEGKKIITRAKTIDKSIFTEVALEELYFPKIKEFNFSSNPIIIDVGAHIGLFSILIDSKVKNSQIHAIEPNSENFNILKEQIILNSMKNISAYRVALSDKKGKMKLYSGEHSARGSLLREEGQGFEEVDTITMEDFFNINKIEKCDLLKMDIEGGEYLVLYSTPKKIFDKISKIFLELHSIEGESKEKMMNFLKQMGFRLEYDADDFIYALKD